MGEEGKVVKGMRGVNEEICLKRVKVLKEVICM